MKNRCKNPQQNPNNESNNTLKRSYTIIKWDSPQGCKDFSIYANQSMVIHYTNKLKNKINMIISLDAQ